MLLAAVAATFGGKEVEFHECRVSAYPFNRVWPGYQRSFEQTKPAYFMSFDVEKGAEFALRLGGDVKATRVRPFRRDQGDFKDGIFRTRIEKPEQFVVEAGGVEYHVFADPLWKYSPREGDRYFGPGVHEVGPIVPKNGERIVLDRGAYVYGNLLLLGVTNVVVEGRGVIDTSKIKRVDHQYPGSKIVYAYDTEATQWSGIDWGTTPVYGRESKGFVLSGVTFVDAPRWTMNIDSCEDFLIDNVKLVGMWRYNADGIDLCDCRRAVVRNSFVRSFDDCFIVRPPTFRDTGTECRELVFSNCVAWCDWGVNLKIQHAQLPSAIHHIRFSDIDCVNVDALATLVTTRYGSNGCEIRDIVFENIRADAPEEQTSQQFQRKDEQKYDGQVKDWIALGSIGAYALGKPTPNQGKPIPLPKDFFKIYYHDITYRNFSVYDRPGHLLDETSKIKPSFGINESVGVPNYSLRAITLENVPGIKDGVRSGK